MKSELSISLIQTNIFWKDISKNINQITKRLEQINNKVDIILLPEMFSTGFTMSPENVYEKMDGKTITWMKEMAVKYESAIAGSIVIKDKSKFFNRFLFVTPLGKVQFYDKRHTFSYVGEDKKYFSLGSKWAEPSLRCKSNATTRLSVPHLLKTALTQSRRSLREDLNERIEHNLNTKEVIETMR